MRAGFRRAWRLGGGFWNVAGEVGRVVQGGSSKIVGKEEEEKGWRSGGLLLVRARGGGCGWSLNVDLDLNWHL